MYLAYSHHVFCRVTVKAAQQYKHGQVLRNVNIFHRCVGKLLEKDSEQLKLYCTQSTLSINHKPEGWLGYVDFSYNYCEHI